MFEGDFADMCAEKFTLVSMGGGAECRTYADTEARTLKGTNNAGKLWKLGKPSLGLSDLMSIRQNGTLNYTGTKDSHQCAPNLFALHKNVTLSFPTLSRKLIIKKSNLSNIEDLMYRCRKLKSGQIFNLMSFYLQNKIHLAKERLSQPNKWGVSRDDQNDYSW